MKKITIAFAMFGLFCCVSCNKYTHEPKIIRNAVKDYDGNKYDAVKIGRQTWMLTNLRTTHYSDGTPIASGLGEDVHSPAYCEIPGVDIASHGLLYNWYAATRNAVNTDGQIQGVCPKGWHMPTSEEWQTLVSAVEGHSGGYYNHAASAMASQAGWQYYPPINMDSLHRAYDSLALIYDYSTPWNESEDSLMWAEATSYYQYCPGANPANNNTSGFSAVPAGIASSTFGALGIRADFWCSGDCPDLYGCAQFVDIYYGNSDVTIYDGKGWLSGKDKFYGLSVRCVKD